MLHVLGTLFEQLINPMLMWIKGDLVGPAIAGIIVIVGSIIIGVTLALTALELNLIRKAKKIIGHRTEEEFAKDFNIIDQDINKLSKINVAWSEFAETLIRPKFDENKNLLHPCENTIRPQFFFNTRELRVGPDFVKVFPSVFVGVGLSLTFLGLIAALGEAVTAINASAGDTGSIQVAIASLLKISSAKFYASLFALFMSIIMTISLRLMSWSLSSSLSSLNRAIETGVRFLRPEKISLDANELLRAQLVQLQTFNTDLALKIGEQVQISLSKSLAPIVQKLEDMGGDMTQQNINAIQEISNKVAQSIQGATAGSMDHVAETLDGISEKLGRLSETLGSALSNFDADFTQMLNGLKDSLTESANGVSIGIGQSMDEMSRGIAETASEISQIVGRLATTVESLATAGAEISRQGGDELRRQVETASKQASEELSQAGQALALGFQNSTQELVATLNASTTQLKLLGQGLVTLPLQLKLVNSGLSTSATKIGEASSEFGAATSSIRSVIEPLANYAETTRNSVTQISETLKLASTQVNEASKEINNAVQTLSTQVGAQLTRLDGADEQLARLLEGIQSSTTRVLSEVNSFVADVDRSFSTSIGALSDSIEEFEEVVDSVGRIFQETRGRE